MSFWKEVNGKVVLAWPTANRGRAPGDQPTVAQ